MVDKSKFVEEENLGYNIFIVGKNFQITDSERKYVWDKLSKIDRLHQHIYNVYVTLEIQKLEHVVSMLIRFDNFKVKVEARTTDMYASIDKAIDKMQNLFRRWKDKIQHYQNKSSSVVDIKVNVHKRPYDEIADYNADIEASKEDVLLPGKVIESGMCKLKILTTNEAIMKMELSSDNFMLYRDEVDQNLKVIYKKDEKNYGILQVP